MFTDPGVRSLIRKMFRLTVFSLSLAACASGEIAPTPTLSKAAAPVCPPDARWDGTQCKRPRVVDEVSCAEGSTWDGQVCIGNLVTDCPRGTRFVQGAGCVAERGVDAATAPSASTSVQIERTPSVIAGRSCGCAPADLACAIACNNRPCRDGSGTCHPGFEEGSAPTDQRPFNRAAAAQALDDAAKNAKHCTEGSGNALVAVTFGTSGRAVSAVVKSGPFVGTAEGTCIAAMFRGASIPQFDGNPVTVSKLLSIP